MGEPSTLVLYNYWRSSSSYRVRIAMAYKELPYEYRAINLLKGEENGAEFLKINPQGIVPALIDGDFVITQSGAILEYLEEKYPERPLLPRGFEQRSLVRSIAQLMISGIQPLHNLPVINKIATLAGDAAKAQWIKDVIGEGLDSVEQMLVVSAGKFCVGDDFSMADCCLVPQMYAAKRFSVDLSRFPTVARVFAALEQHPACVAAHPDNAPDAVKA